MLDQKRDHKLIDACVLVDMVIEGCTDKSKSVRDKIGVLAPKIAGLVNQDLLKQRIKEQKPVIRETLTNSLKKAGFLKPSPEPLERAKVKKVNTSSDYEKALKILDSSPAAARMVYLQSVMSFGEPTDIEISNLHSQLAYIIDEATARQLFSFEGVVFQQTIERLKLANIYTKDNIMGLFQLIYIRVFDTRRKIVLDTVESFLEFIHHAMTQKDIFIEAKKDVLICMHALVRFAVARQRYDAIANFVGLVNNDHLIKQFEALLAMPGVAEHEGDILHSLEHVLKVLDHKCQLPRGLLLQLKKLESAHRAVVTNVFQCIKPFEQYSALVEDPELSHIFEKDKHILEEINFNDIRVIDNHLRNSTKDHVAVFNNIEAIVWGFLKFNSELMLADTYNTSAQKLTYLKLSMDVSRMLSNLKGLLEKAKPSTAASFIEHLIACLLRIDENKAAFDFASNKAFSADEIIQNLNFCVLKLLEHNDPNVLFEQLLGLLDKSNKELLDPGVMRNVVKFRGIVVKCIIKLTKAIRKFVDRLDVRRLLEVFKWYFKEYKNAKEDVGLKSVKTVLNELVSLKGEEIGRYIVGIEDDTDQAFMMCISKYLGKDKKEDTLEDTGRKSKITEERFNKSNFSNN